MKKVLGNQKGSATLFFAVFVWLNVVILAHTLAPEAPAELETVEQTQEQVK